MSQIPAAASQRGDHRPRSGQVLLPGCISYPHHETSSIPASLIPTSPEFTGCQQTRGCKVQSFESPRSRRWRESVSQAVPECHQAGTGWVEHRILTCCFPLGAEGLGSTLWTSVFWGLLPSLYAEGIWGLATRGRAVCCGLPAPCPLLCPIYSQCPCLQAHLFPFPELLAGFLAGLRPFLCSLFLRGLAPGVCGAHRRVQCPRTPDPASHPPSGWSAAGWDRMGWDGSKQGMEQGNVPACLGEPGNSSEEKLRLFYLVQGSWQGLGAARRRRADPLSAQGQVWECKAAPSCRFGRNSVPPFTSVQWGASENYLDSSVSV